MIENNNELDSDIWKEIKEQFENLKLASGVDPDETYQRSLEDMFGLTQEDLDDMDRHTEVVLRTKQIDVNVIDDSAVFPKYAYPTDSGFDLYSTIDYTLPPFGRALIPTGLRFSFDEGTELQIRPKSGLAINQGLTVLNTPGTVDAGYTGEIKVILFNTNNSEVTINKGMKIAQAVFCPVMNGRYINFNRVDEIKEKDRKDNGFGSTGIQNIL
jgi:dUTP pyrophosphatase